MRVIEATELHLDRVIEILDIAVPLMNKSGNFQWDSEYPNREVFLDDIIKGDLFVVKIDGVIAAAVSINNDLAEEYNDLSWTTSPHAISIHRMVVDPDYRGQGIAKAIFKFAEKHALSLGYSSIWADTNEMNSTMLSIFKGFGYHFTGIVHFRGQKSNFHCFEKDLLL